MIKNITFGSDAEVFLQTLEGNVFPACGLIGGTKDQPKPMPNRGLPGWYIQEDNVLLEFNIPPAKDAKTFVQNMWAGLNLAKGFVPPSMMVLENVSSARIPEVYIQSIFQASVFGCDPDYNAWTMTQNEKPQAADPLFRTAAAHVHIGWDNPQEEDQINLIKMADIFVSIPSIRDSKDKERRKLYGRAGAFRPKDYGVEHRVLDNYFIFNQYTCLEVIEAYIQAAVAVNLQMKIDPLDEDDIQGAINTYDWTLGLALLKKYSKRFSGLLDKNLTTLNAATKEIMANV